MRATGRMAAVLRPRSPSDNQSTERPLANAMNMPVIVLMLGGMQRTIAGSIVSMTYGPSWL
jgi:hypothetical protein